MIRWHRVFVLIAVLAGFASGFALAQGERSDEEVLREIKEVLWPRAYATQDVELLDHLLAEEFQLISAEGSWSTKAEEIAWLRENAPGYDSLVFTIKRLDVFENGTAVVAGQGDVAGTGEDGPWTMTYQSTNVLIKRDGRWQAIASHVSGVQID